MIRYYISDQGMVQELKEPQDGCWIEISAAELEECEAIANQYHIELTDLTAALDEEESSRVMIEDTYTMVLVDIPKADRFTDELNYATIPLSMIFNDQVFITVCSQPTIILSWFSCGHARCFSTRKHLRFVYQILEQTAALYQADLRRINKVRDEIEQKAGDQLAYKDLISLHKLETSLTYFATSLRANEGVLTRLQRYVRIKRYPEDDELLEDVIIETQQAIEMTSIYRDITNGTRELLAAMADNRLNNVMKYLTSLTLVLAIPTIISGFYGMNVNENYMPLANTPHGFLLITLITIAICLVVMVWLKKRRML